MSFTLTDLGTESYEFNASVWNWKAALEVIRSMNILSEGSLRQMNYNATGVKVSMAEAHEIGEKIEREWLPRLQPNKRVFADLSITDAPDDMTLHRDGDEQWKNYSASHDWLAELAAFCRRSKGFQVF